MMNQLTLDKYNLMMVEERARHLLPRDESDAVLRHIKTVNIWKMIMGCGSLVLAQLALLLTIETKNKQSWLPVIVGKKSKTLKRFKCNMTMGILLIDFFG